MTVIGPFVGHYHDRVYCGVCSHCHDDLILLASHSGAECFMLALCETCDAPTVAQMWGDLTTPAPDVRDQSSESEE